MGAFAPLHGREAAGAIMRAVRTVAVTRYVTPLREGGSLPAIIEADDDGMYVLKFRGAGQGPKVLAAELLAGELARAAGLPVPAIVFAELDAELARTEGDPEIQSLIRASAGLNLAVDYLPGAVAFDPVIETPAAELASQIVWFDAFVTNVDRTARNTNLLMWHRRLWLIDQGAALYFHHAWDDDYIAHSRTPFPMIKDHVLLPFAAALEEADRRMAERITPEVIETVVARLPSAWLVDDAEGGLRRDPQVYVDYLVSRLQSRQAFLEEAIRARSRHL
jgi:hypothetical protein